MEHSNINLEEKPSQKSRKLKKLPVAISEEEFTSLIEHTKKKHHKVAFLLGFGAGLRISEIINLEPRDISINEKKILVRQGKGGKDRIVPLPKGFREDFLEILPMKCGSRALELGFKKAASKANLLEKKPSLHFHSLRHGFATQCVSNGIPIHHVRTLLGHSNIATTNIYLEMNPKEALKAYQEMF